jgi:hypothetical protein
VQKRKKAVTTAPEESRMNMRSPHKDAAKAASSINKSKRKNRIKNR